jgi:hypothetical protein
MKNLAITTLAVVTLTIFAGDARAQGSFFGNLFGFTRPVSNTSYYGTTYPATNCTGGVCTTTQYRPNSNNSGYYGTPTGSSYHNTYPSYYGSGNNYSNWTTPQAVVPASYSNCPGGYCPQTPLIRPTTPYNTTPYNTMPYTPGNYAAPVYTAPAYNTPAYNTPTYNTPTYNTPNFNNGPYYNSY